MKKIYKNYIGRKLAIYSDENLTEFYSTVTDFARFRGLSIEQPK